MELTILLLIGILIGLLLGVNPRRWERYHLWHLFAFIAFIACLFAWLVASIRTAKEAAIESSCHGRLFKVAFALYEYHDFHHTFPPRQAVDPQGNTVRWPELVAPVLLGSGAETAGFLDVHFRCTPRAKFLLATGPHTITQDQSVKREQVTDGLENTLVVLEVPASDEQPESWELALRDLDGRGADEEAASATRVHSAGSGMIFADGAIYRLLSPLSVAQLRALLTIDGGESLTRADLERAGQITRISAGPRARP
jgi:hypothetical protein